MITAPERSAAESFERLLDLLRGRRIVAVVGAGCSTESGIPDYRGPQGSLRTRKPVQYKEFVGSDAWRARYWARSAIGWAHMTSRRPNAAHLALARLEEGGLIRGLITQNVDGLHQAAGSRRVVELHGTLSRVCCLDCGEVLTRDDHQRRLAAANAGWLQRLEAAAAGGQIDIAPDGDAELADRTLAGFAVPGCPACGGILKPDVVFFGENVPATTVADAWELYGEGEVLLVVGSSLTVYSGRRFVHRAERDGVPVAVVNLGPTRADDVAVAKVEGRLGSVLPRLADELLAAR